jgi:hypothetical protein
LKKLWNTYEKISSQPMLGWMNHELGCYGLFAKPIEPQPKLTKGFFFFSKTLNGNQQIVGVR